MLPKKNRVDKKTLTRIFKEGKSISSSFLTFKFMRGSAGKRVSFTAPKTVAKLATKRNLLRRRGYQALEKHFKNMPDNIKGVFIFKQANTSSADLEMDIVKILQKI